MDIPNHTPGENQRREYYSEEAFRKDALSLVKSLLLSSPDGFDAVIGIRNGGIHPTLYVYSFCNLDKTKLLWFDRNLNAMFEVEALKEAKSILIVDDILDTGQTLAKVLEYLETVVAADAVCSIGTVHRSGRAGNYEGTLFRRFKFLKHLVSSSEVDANTWITYFWEFEDYLTKSSSEG